MVTIVRTTLRTLVPGTVFPMARRSPFGFSTCLHNIMANLQELTSVFARDLESSRPYLPRPAPSTTRAPPATTALVTSLLLGALFGE